MLERLRNRWQALRSSLWFVPALMSFGGFALAYFALSADAGLAREGEQAWWIYGGGPSDARSLLSTLLSSMITITALIVSITMVVLTLAANQLGPRIIRSFMADLTTQIVLGVYPMTIAYLLLVLRMVTEDLEFKAVPHIAVTAGTALSLLSLFVLLFFVHHLARSLVSNNVVARVAEELRQGACRLMPEAEAHPADAAAQQGALDGLREAPATVALDRHGYVQAVSYGEIAEAARRCGLRARLTFRPGHFVTRGALLVAVEPESAASPEFVEALNGAVVTGTERTPTQDIEHSIRHLVEIALRALSPGVNDPFTAQAVLDALVGGLGEVMSRPLPPEIHCDEDGAPRVLSPVSDYDGLIGAAFNQIRQASDGKPDMLIHLLDSLGALSGRARLPVHRSLLAEQAGSVIAAARRSVADSRDLAEAERRHALALTAIFPPAANG